MITESSWDREITPREFKNTGCSQTIDTSQRSCHNCSCGMKAVEKLMWHDIRTGTQKVIWDDQMYPHHKPCILHLFPNSCPVWMKSVNGYDIKTLQMSSFWTKLYGYTWDCIQCPQQSHLDVGIILMLMNMSIKTTSVSTFGLVSSKTLLWATMSYLTG